MRQNTKKRKIPVPEIKGSNRGENSQNDGEGRPRKAATRKTQKAAHAEYNMKGYLQKHKNKSEMKNPLNRFGPWRKLYGRAHYQPRSITGCGMFLKTEADLGKQKGFKK